MRSSFIILLLAAVAFSATAQTVTIADLSPHHLEIKAFTLPTDQNLKIDGSGGVFADDGRPLLYYGWILNADNREVVWHLFDELKGVEFEDREGLIDFSLDLELKAGNYELYFTGSHDNRNWSSGDWTINDFDDMIDEIFESREKEKFRWSLREELFIQVEAPGLKAASVDDFYTDFVKDARVYFTKAQDSERFEQGFNLSDETDIRIYAIGEGRKGETYDYLWIYDMESRERVFEMDYRNTRFAGGADKNLKVDEQITLPKGSYLVSYRTDDSHSFEQWNALPPDDPQFWGVTLFPASQADADNFKDYEPPKTARPLIAIDKVRNNELESMGFSLLKDMEVRLLCLGEGAYEQMADYGWIVDARTRDIVWKMDGYRSEHAGGADKNRRYAGEIELKKGDYIAYYSTDGSHAYNSWNSARPHEEDQWGLTIWATNEEDMDQFETFSPDEYMAGNVIAEIVRIRNNDYERESFILDETTDVTIVALGEGKDRRMYDYGWIKNMDTGEVVWEMEYYKTEHAGGDSKNRMITATRSLPKGEYRVYYETDDSHAFLNWNSDPPHDPESYGIRVLVAE